MEPLFDVPYEPRPLTDRQTWIYRLIIAAGAEGVTADELGALLHGRKHDAGVRCDFCGQDGLRALNEKAIAERVVKRGHSYVAVGAPSPEPPQPSVQISELPGESFEDMFGSEAT